MKTLKYLSDLDLVLNTKNLVGEEKRVTQLVLEHLAEIETRRLYAERGFSSLFDFCVNELKYSESSAQRRISSMRLIKALPEAREKLEAGRVNLSTLSQLQTFIKREESFKKVKLDRSAKLELLNSIENKSQRDCEKVFIERSPEMVLSAKESLRPITNEMTEIKFIASKELEEKLSELKNLLAHQNKTGTTAELVEILADMVLKKLRLKENGLVPKRTAATAAEIKRRVWRRDSGECQFTDPLTKRKCKSKFKLQIDHIHPKALGGDDTEDNLRLLCQSHNQLAAIQVFSTRHMSQFLPGLRS